MTVTVEIPMTLPSASNLREHWAAKARRVKAQRVHAWSVLNAAKVASVVGRHGYGDWERDGHHLAITLTRVAPRKLDDDNLRGAFKAVRDEVAAYFGVDDADPRLEWRYEQAKGKAAVRIAFDVVDSEARLEAMQHSATAAHAETLARELREELKR